MPVYKDEKRGTWYVSTYVEYRDGTKKRVMKRGFKTKREATQYENELLFESSMNSSLNPTLEEVTQEYLEMSFLRCSPFLKKDNKNKTFLFLEYISNH